MLIDAPPRNEQPAHDEEALFREARRLRRRRWVIGLLSAAVVLGGGTAIAELATSGGSAPASAKNSPSPGDLPAGSLATLKLAGALAVGPNGALYVVDVARNRILVRLTDGRFRVVAGTGKAGFSGDGGPALRAELSGVTGLAFSPAGSLYVVDAGHVRVISPNGGIRTVAGNGRPLRVIADGTPALLAPLGSAHQIAHSGTPPSIAFSPGGQLYIGTGGQILRLTAAGTLTTVRAVATSAPYEGHSITGTGHLYSFGPIAIDAQGNIDVAGVNGWSIWQVNANGRAHEVGFARQSPGNYSALERGPDGAVYGENGTIMVRVEHQRLVTTFAFTKPVHGEYFWPTYFASGRSGVIYLDEIPGDSAYEAHQQLVSVRNTHVSLLWQERNTKTGNSFSPR
jgi:hypothetical protein